MLKENDVSEDVPNETISGTNPEEAIDVEIGRIEEEK
jgi:hypothetical protein